ncbi:sigma-70 family RNA polymerase sigma factor [Streptomyces sp. WMMC500]|uniref:sigma-70 family RNA polymerase sigma factor n=1 Tax=Streptomyces sp. WMMC500 TaxID=3015154 RepID=UPI00248B6626|nr:sigma-70 family RNA polymerase sigma factor [Streptomyces sp. WMMC500]WBB61222.1 sigma-70 family RNA polymerase sigma factor [Streptomyces sp. WMMC500]
MISTCEPPAQNRTDESAFAAVRPRLFAIAYRYLQDVGEAEDVVQETWLRWARTDRSVVVNPSAFLATTATRLAINVACSARRRREKSVGPSLLAEAGYGGDLGSAAERYEAVDLTVRLLLEKLSPAERAAYLLRKAFDYPYRRISELLSLGESYARQLVRRAGAHLAEDRRRPVDTTTHQRLVRAFLDAAETGDLDGLEELLVAGLTLRASA